MVMKNLNHTFRRFIQKQALKLFRYLNTEQERSIYERDCIAVCKKFIYEPDSIMLLTPISGKRYIRSENNQIFIILESHRVKIINQGILESGKPIKISLESLQRSFLKLCQS